MDWDYSYVSGGDNYWQGYSDYGSGASLSGTGGAEAIAAWSPSSGEAPFGDVILEEQGFAYWEAWDVDGFFDVLPSPNTLADDGLGDPDALISPSMGQIGGGEWPIDDQALFKDTPAITPWPIIGDTRSWLLPPRNRSGPTSCSFRRAEFADTTQRRRSRKQMRCCRNMYCLT